jgi:hypothetical protein
LSKFENHLRRRGLQKRFMIISGKNVHLRDLEKLHGNGLASEYRTLNLTKASAIYDFSILATMQRSLNEMEQDSKYTKRLTSIFSK